MNTEEIINLYVNKNLSLRTISKKFNTNHHKIKRILIKEGVKINSLKVGIRTWSDKEKEIVGKERKKYFKKNVPYNKGIKVSKETVYKNMKAHLKYDVTMEWLLNFKDIEKLKFLNRSITKNRNKVGFTTEIYKNFIEKFYIDEQFNSIYETWIQNNKYKYLKPSLDHIIPISKNGSSIDLDNLQFLTWFENRCKNDMSITEWTNLKNNIENYFYYK